MKALFKSNVMEVMRYKPFVLFWFARVSTAIAFQMITVAVGWQIYALTGNAFYLGLVGLAQFLPMFLLTIVVGHVADRYDRRKIAWICQLIEGAGTLLLGWGSYSGWINKESILGIVVLIGAARAFEGPSMQALMPALVSMELFPKAVAWAAASMQTAFIIGPALGGLFYAIGPAVAYSIAGVMSMGAAIFVSLIQIKLSPVKREPVSFKTLFAGIAFIRSKSIILGAISLDLFAVLLGGATALLPVYAKHILYTGPWGLGLLRSAPAVGALIMSVFLMRHPLKRQVGRIMFSAVAIFGVTTLVFAVSTSFLLSFGSLIVLGAADVISVVIRSSLIQMGTPDEMRGRVSAVNSMFIGTSNQLGEFESGMTAAWFGVVPAVLIGGFGTLVVILCWIIFFPELFKADTLQVMPE